MLCTNVFTFYKTILSTWLIKYPSAKCVHKVDIKYCSSTYKSAYPNEFPTIHMNFPFLMEIVNATCNIITFKWHTLKIKSMHYFYMGPT